MTYCKNAKPGVHANDSNDMYGGYCLDCYYAGVPEMEAEIERGRKALAFLKDNYPWLRESESVTAEMEADLDAILDGWKLS